jgi:membrane associated rhomboid family serine protease
MFLPLDRKPDWHHPPVVTLLLVLVNLVCFFVLQINDDQYRHDAVNYYFSSDLPETELSAYRRYLENPANPTAFPDSIGYLDTSDTSTQGYLLSMLIVDGPFLQQLTTGKIIKLGDPEYSEWQSQRARFETLLNRSVEFRFSQINIHPSLLTLFSAMFIHADVVHLLGNMVFLFLFGFVVEMALGRTLYLFAYLFSGLMSGLFYLALEPNSAFLAMGASGAISGLAGMYTVLFGLRKIRFFYTLLFYFDYIRAPAIILLPIWLGYELFNQFFTDDNINNLSHIGGLLSGALIAWLAKKYLPSINMEYLDAEEKAQNFKLNYQQGVEALAAMEIDEARRIFMTLADEQPDNVDIMLQLYNVAKLSPQSEAVHSAANKILNLPGSDKATVKILHNIFIDYVELVQPNVRLRPEQMMSLALRFAANNYLEDAEKIVLHLTTRATEYERNAEGLMALATHYKRINNTQKADKYLSLLLQCYPDSHEAQHARQAFSQV